MIGYKTGNDMSADLKRTAHRVRQAVDALPLGKTQGGQAVNPRRARMIARTSAWIDGAISTAAVRLESPNLSGRDRHALAHGHARGSRR